MKTLHDHTDRMASLDAEQAAHKPLTRDEVRSVIQGRTRAGRVPFYIHFWVHPEAFGAREPLVRKILARYPVDIQLVPYAMPTLYQEPDTGGWYSWLPYANPAPGRTLALDAASPMPDWRQLDDVLAAFPRASCPGRLHHAAPPDGRYRLGHWWFCLFERHWQLRGMTNALTDYYEYPADVHRLFRALTDFYMGIMERGAREQQLDGVLTSDDLGTQTAPFFSLNIFREFFKPYYAEMIARAHALGLQFWMHACGNVQPFIPEWIETGLDVLHPIQKHTMDERAVATQFGDRSTIFAGLDVQRILPWGTPADVRAEVRFLLDTYWKRGVGRCLLTAGNGINQDCPIENLEAFFDEALRYGAEVVR